MRFRRPRRLADRANGIDGRSDPDRIGRALRATTGCTRSGPIAQASRSQLRRRQCAVCTIFRRSSPPKTGFMSPPTTRSTHSRSERPFLRTRCQSRGSAVWKGRFLNVCHPPTEVFFGMALHCSLRRIDIVIVAARVEPIRLRLSDLYSCTIPSNGRRADLQDHPHRHARVLCVGGATRRSDPQG